MKTVVTGGAGFIGSHLVKRLVDEGRSVIVASDFFRHGPENLSDLGIQPSSLEPGSWNVATDLRDYNQALKVMGGAETVFHLAARVGSIEYLHSTEMAELEALQTNLVIDVNVFRACLESSVRKLVYASSAAVYPVDLQQSPNVTLTEDTLRYFNPDGGYGWAKLMGEIQLGWMNDIDIGIARIFNVYGENEPLGEKAHVIADLIRKAILYPEEEFIVWGDGKQSRDFLYVSDCVDALLELEKRASNPPIVVNIGSGQPVSIGTIAEKVVALSGKDIKIVYDPAKPVGPLSRTADISQAKALLKWEPRIDLDEGLRRTYAWVEKKLKRGNTCK